MSQIRLVDLERLNIESSIARQVDFDSVTRNFSNKNTVPENRLCDNRLH